MTRLKLPQIDKNIFYIIPLYLLLATDNLYHPFASPEEGLAPAYVQFISNFLKLAGLAAVGVSLINLRKLRGFLLFFNVILLAYLATLIFESLYLYNSFLMYPHVISKLFDLFVVLALLSSFKDRTRPNFHLMIHFIVLGLIMKIAINPSMLSPQAFVDHDRGLPAGSVFLLSLPCLYYFNQYVTSQKMGFLLLFLFLLIFIFIANHRTVWVTLTFSLFVNLILIRKNKKFKISKMIPAILLVIIVSVYTMILAMSYSSEIEEKFMTNVTNILNPTEDGTGSWRVLQMESYWPIVENNIFTGLRWKGFEVPIQFFHPDAGTPYFEDGTGHHFHSFYFDKLFYFGILGLILFLVPVVLPVVLVLWHKLILNNVQLSFFIFSLSGLVYGISYFLPFSFWFTLGITLIHIHDAYLSKLRKESVVPSKDIDLHVVKEEEVANSLYY
jgi:hypothetical protein